MKARHVLLLVLLAAAVPAAAASPLPLPDAPVVLRISDVGAFDRALSGGLRKALSGKLPAADPAGSAWRRTRVGSKLEAQWALFAGDLPLSWPDIMALRPSEIGISLLSAGNLELVLAVRTPLSVFSLRLPAGTSRLHQGIAWHLVTRGAGDSRTLDRRIGLAWARTGDVLLIATSERALLLALDQKGAPSAPAPLKGFAQLRLDMDQLQKDLYFRREFLFPEGRAPRGIVHAALGFEGDSLVEVREGETGEGASGARWNIEARAVQAAGWESDGSRFFGALRRAFLEPVPEPPARPVPPFKPIPSAQGVDDRYLVDLTRPSPEAGKPGEGELPGWTDFLARAGISGWGWEIGEEGAVRLVVQEPPAFDARFLELSEATLRRRTGGATREGGALSVGPGLPALAVRRTGKWLWIATRAEDLSSVPEPVTDAALLRWGQARTSLLSAEARAWAEAEGTFSPDTTRPFSDRILGLLGWAPSLRTISVERRREGGRFQERVVFGFASAPQRAAPPAKAPKRTTKASKPKKS